jgi:hypothetical protein
MVSWDIYEVPSIFGYHLFQFYLYSIVHTGNYEFLPPASFFNVFLLGEVLSADNVF